MGGDSSSQSTNQSTTNNIDKRLAIGEGGLGVSGDHNTINVTDGGAVAGAIDLSKTSLDVTRKSVQDVLNLTKDVFKASLDNSTEAMGSVKAAWADATTAKQTADTASTQQIMKIGGVVLVGVIAAMALKKGN